MSAAVLPSAARAHFLWAHYDAPSKKVMIGLRESPTDDTPVALAERIPRVKAWGKAKMFLKIDEQDAWLKTDMVGDVVGITLDYGVLDRKSQGRGVFWLNYYAKVAMTPAASQTQVGLPVELTLKPGTGGKSIVTVLDGGKPAAGAEVQAESHDLKVTFEGKTGPDGTIEIPPIPGMIAVRGLVVHNKKGEHEGKPYEMVRSYCALTVYQEGDAKPLSRQLREAFGKNHTVVGKTAFIETLMSGKLNKAQLIDHYAQRALVHQEIDRILSATDQPVPYGQEQKDVLKYLRADMDAIGAKWPTEADAWPVTRDFLKQIRASEEQGPYFALGILHVYYGGITHGGRHIGEVIADTVKVPTPAYYLKSDGYDAYIEKLNTITNSTAQKETVRGGVAAYKYIIDSNQVDSFKSK